MEGKAISAAVERGLRRALADLEGYSTRVVQRALRPYQLEAGAAILAAVRAQDARTVTVQMSRQAGKNELSAQVEGYLMTLHAQRGGSIVKVSPTFRPQALTSMMRLREVLANPLAEVRPTENSFGYVVSRGKARAFFLSAEPGAHVVGATASLMLEVDEAQDVDVEKHDRELAPMAASTAAARVYYGTGGRDDDLLQRTIELNRALEAKDGVRRHFAYPWWVVAEHSRAYGRFVEAEIARLGKDHPTILSEYELKPVARVGSLFGPAGLRQLQGEHARMRGPREGRRYVAGVDVAGAGEREWDEGDGGDATVITIGEMEEPEHDWWEAEECEADEEPEGAEGWPEAASRAPGPIVRVVEIVELRGESHLLQHEEMVAALRGRWNCAQVAFDSTGLGAAPCELLRRRMGGRVRPFLFTAASKSALGYDLLAAVNGGRVKMWVAGADDRESNAFWAQVRAARRSVHEGGRLGWGARSGHDDYVASLALCLRAAESLEGRHRP
jgi:hypothetical protein